MTILGFVLVVVFLFAASKGDWSVSFLSLAAAIGCFVPIRRRMRELADERSKAENGARQLRYELAQREATFFENLSTAKSLPDLNQQVKSLVLAPDETCVLVSQYAKRVVSKERTQYVGGTAGVSIRVAKGVRVRAGGFKGEPVKTSYTEIADTGTVYLTNQRFIFAGANEVATIPLSKVASVRDDSDTVEIIQENRAKPLTIKLGEEFRGSVVASATLAMAQLEASGKGHRKR